MNLGTFRTISRAALAAAACGSALNASAEIFFGGDTKGLPGESVELTISARAGTVLEAMNINPLYAPVADKLDLVGLTGTTELLTGSDLSICNDNRTCAVLYVDGKTFASDAMLISLRFDVATDAPVGPVPLNLRLKVGEDTLVIPPAQTFEVLAIPEPQHWALLLAGLALIACTRSVGRNS